MILVLGEILFDLFPDGKKLGGAPFNFSFHLKNLGFDVRFVSRVGKDANGREIIDFLGTHGFSLDDIQIDPDHATGMVRILIQENGSHEFKILSNAAWDNISCDRRLCHLLETPPDLIYFGSLIQRQASGQELIQKILAARKTPTKIFCDINLRPASHSPETVKTCLGACDILKLSHEELIEITGIDPFAPSLEGRMKGFMADHGIGLVILTMGSKGSQWFAADKTHKIVPDTFFEPLDTVGAGDAYAAVSAAGLALGLPMEQIMEFAHKFASIICGIRGALPADLNLYKDFVNKMGIT